MNFREFEASLFGGKSSAPSDGAAAPIGSGPSPFRQPMAWIKAALGLQSGQPPQALDTSQILSAMDVMQGGWPFAVYEGAGVQIAGVLGGGNPLNLTPANVGFQYVILACAIVHTSAAAQRVQFFLGDPQNGGIGNGPNFAPPLAIPQTPVSPAVALIPVQAMLSDITVAAGTTGATIVTLASRQVVVPPGLVLSANALSALGAGELLTIHVAWAKIPAGFRV